MDVVSPSWYLWWWYRVVLDGLLLPPFLILVKWVAKLADNQAQGGNNEPTLLWITKDNDGYPASLYFPIIYHIVIHSLSYSCCFWWPLLMRAVISEAFLARSAYIMFEYCAPQCRDTVPSCPRFKLSSPDLASKSLAQRHWLPGSSRMLVFNGAYPIRWWRLRRQWL